MPLDPSSITTLIFDYGNTLIEFGRQQVDSCDGRISAELRRLFGPHDEAHFRQMRDRDRFSPYQGDHREQDLRAMAASWVTDLYGRKSEREHVDSLLAVRHAALVDAIDAPDVAADLRARLNRSTQQQTGRRGERMKIGLRGNDTRLQAPHCSELARDPNALAGRGAVLVFQKLYRQVFRRNKPPPENDSFLSRIQFDIGATDPKTGQQSASARVPLSDQIVLVGGVDVGGNFRGQVKYLIRFR